MKITEEQKSVAMHYWYVFVIIGLMVCAIVLYQNGQNTKAELNSLKSQFEMNEEIKKTEERLNAMRARELEYLKVFASQEKLNKTLADLEKKQRELQKLKKGNIENEIKKMSDTEMLNQFNTMGLRGYIRE